MDFSTNNNWFKLPTFWLFLLIMLAFLACYAFRPITDPDFWWHLKSGEQIWLNKGLLQQDPFAYTSDGFVTAREKLILQGYWLWQLIAHGLYALSGFKGIFILNFVTLCSMLIVTAWQLRRREVEIVLAAPLLALVFTLLSHFYYMERPQVVSFLFTALLLGLLNEVRAGGRLGWPLPILMVLWSNIHGGYIVGQILLCLFTIGAVYEYRSNHRLLRHIFLWTFAALFASLLNPNGATALFETLKFYDTPLMTAVWEYQSTFTIFMTGSYQIAILWVLIGGYVLGLWFSRRCYWPEIFMALFLAWFSVTHVRNIAFFALAMLPAVGDGVQRGFDRLSGKKILAIKLALMVLAVTGLGLRGWDLRQEKMTQSAVNRFYPSAVVDFLQRSSLQGNMFNHYTFGGYLMWHLYPDRQVFIDGRGINPATYNDWVAISSASLEERSSGKKKYEELLDQYNIDFVIHPPSLLFSGRITALVKFLLNKPEWIPIYVDPQAYILVRDTVKNQQVIEAFAQDKRLFVEKIIENLKHRTLLEPNNVKYRVGLAEMLIFYGRYDQAQRQIDAIRNTNPRNPELPHLINQLMILKSGQQEKTST